MNGRNERAAAANAGATVGPAMAPVPVPPAVVASLLSPALDPIWVKLLAPLPDEVVAGQRDAPPAALTAPDGEDRSLASRAVAVGNPAAHQRCRPPTGRRARHADGVDHVRPAEEGTGDRSGTVSPFGAPKAS